MAKKFGAILWITRIGEDGGVFASLVADPEVVDGGEQPMDEYGCRIWSAQAELVPEATEIRVASVEAADWEVGRSSRPLGLFDEPMPLPKLEPGDVVVARNFIGAPDGDTASMIRLCGARVVGRADNKEGVQAAMVAAFGQFSSQKTEFLPLAHCLSFDAAAERAKGEPNSALILAYRDGDKLVGHVLAHTGAYLFWQVADLGKDPEQVGLGLPDEPGIYVLENGEVWTDHGNPGNDFEYSDGIDGELLPATLEQIAAWGFDDAKLMSVVREELKLEYPEGMGWREALAWVPDEELSPEAPHAPSGEGLRA